MKGLIFYIFFESWVITLYFQSVLSSYLEWFDSTKATLLYKKFEHWWYRIWKVPDFWVVGQVIWVYYTFLPKNMILSILIAMIVEQSPNLAPLYGRLLKGPWLESSLRVTNLRGQSTVTSLRSSLGMSITAVQVNLFQKHLFLHQLTHNMTKDCSWNYLENYRLRT